MALENWKSTTVASCLEPLSLSGKAKIQSRDYRPTGRFPIVDQGQEKIAGWTDDEDAVIESPLPLVVFGDHTRVFKYIDFPFVRGADGTQVLKVCPDVDPLFFYYACSALDIPSRGYNRHFTILKEKEISYPLDKQEQRSIGLVLQHVERLAELQATILGSTADLKRAAMRELFTRGLRGEPQRETEIGLVPESWEVGTFGDVREFLQYGTSTRCTTEVGPYPVLRIPNVALGRVEPSDLKYCSLPDAEAEKYILADGDVLFIRTNGVLERLGSCAVYSGEPNRALFASYLIRGRLKSNVLPKYVSFFYGSDFGTSLVAGRATPAADGKYNLNTGTIDSLPLAYPKTVEEQAEIVSILDAIDKKLDLHKQKRAVLEELFKTLLHKLMTGEVRVEELDLSALNVVGTVA